MQKNYIPPEIIIIAGAFEDVLAASNMGSRPFDIGWIDWGGND